MTCDLCLSANPLPFIAPPLSQASYKEILPAPCTLQMCNLMVKGLSFSQPTYKARSPLGICTGNSSVTPTVEPEQVTWQSIVPSIFCRQGLNNQAVEYPSFCKVLLLLSFLTNDTLYFGCYLQHTRCFMEKPRLGSEVSPSILPPGHPFQMSFWGKHNPSCLPLFQWKSTGQNTFRCLDSNTVCQ